MYYLLFLYVFCIPLEGVLPHLMGSDPILTPYRIAGGLLSLCFFAQVTVGRRPLLFDLYDRLLLFVLVFLNVTCLALQNFLSPIDTFYKLPYIALLVGFGITTYLIVKNLNLTPRTVEMLLWVFVISVLCSAVEMAQSVVSSQRALARYSGFADSPNTAAFNAGFALLILVGNQLKGTGSLLLRFALLPATTLLVAFALITTQSRGSLFAVAIALFVMFFLAFAKKSIRTTTLRVAVLVPVLGLCLAPSLDVDWQSITYRLRRLSPGGEHSSQMLSGREELWPMALAMSRDSYFLGIGLEQAFPLSEQYLEQLPNRTNAFVKTSVHSDFLLLLVETGILGITLYAFCLWLLVGNLLRRYWNSGPQGPYIVLTSTTVYLALTQIGRHAFCDPGMWLFLALATLSCRERFQASEQIHVQLIERPVQ